MSDLQEDVVPVVTDTCTDAVPGRPVHDWQRCLIEIDGGLDSNDIICLKFLLRGYISDSKLQKNERGIDLFQSLDHSGAVDISKGQLELIEECLYRIHRKDLLRKIPRTDPDKVKQRLDRNRQEIRHDIDVAGKLRRELMPFRILLFEIGEDVDETEFKSALFSLSTLVPRGQLSKMKTVFDLFLYLEKKDELSPGNVEILPRVLKNIDRSDMLKKVEMYRNNYEFSRNLGQERPPSADHASRRTPGSNTESREERETEVEQTATESPRPVELPRQNRMTRKPSISDGTLINIANDLKDCRLGLPDIAKDLGLTEAQITAQVQRSESVPFCNLNILKFWQTEVMKNSEDCRTSLIRVLQKHKQKKALATLGIVQEDHQTEPVHQHVHSEPEFTPPRQIRPLPKEQDTHPEPVPLPPVFSTRPVTEMETQTSMLHLPSGVFPATTRQDDQPNYSVSTSEARIAFPTQLREPSAPEQTTVEASTPEIHPQQQDELVGQLRGTYIDEITDLPCYKMNSKPRGKAVIINNKNFFKVPNDPESKEMPPRVGTDEDARKLVFIFNKLGFITSRYDDLEDYAMNRQMVEQAFLDHSNYDCFVCCILSHGALGNVYGTNGRLVRIQELTSSFRAQRCPSLAGKPKLFFIQACQGREKQQGHDIEADAAGVRDLESDSGAREMIPDEADFVLGYATVPGYVSYRSRTQGSWFVNKLVQMLDKYADRFDLMSILVKVNEEVGRANANLEGGLYKQIPAPLVTLRKKLYFR